MKIDCPTCHDRTDYMCLDCHGCQHCCKCSAEKVGTGWAHVGTRHAAVLLTVLLRKQGKDVRDLKIG